MSQSDDFLSRWSRRKQQVAKEAASLKDVALQRDEDKDDKDDKTDKAVASASETVAPEVREAEPLFDLSELPSLDSIGPDSDVSLFMRPGVPTSLSHAALRRVWSADPAIRDFIGLSENSWDFTKPDSITGFGPLLPTDDIKKMLASIIRDEETVPEQTPGTALQQPDTEARDNTASSQAAEIDGDSVTVEGVDQPQPEIASQCTQNDLTAQQDPNAKELPDAALKRRHGGALPT